MLFGKKKKKLDARVRFQHSTFTKKLGTARNYKRQARVIPEFNGFSIFATIGLRTWWAKLLALIAIVGVLYLIYIPNFLFVKVITISGIDGDTKTHVTALVNQYLEQAPFYNPRRNLVFLRAAPLSKYIISKDTRISKVTIKRNFFKRTLTVSANAKYIAYIISRQNIYYSVYNDGTVIQVEPLDGAQWMNSFPGTLKIVDAQPNSLEPGQQYFTPELMSVANYLQQHFKADVAQDMTYIELPARLARLPVQLVVHVHKNLPNLNPSMAEFAVLIDPKKDLTIVLEKLNLLLSQTTPDRYKALKYIDMRFDDKGFVCLVNTPCANQPLMPQVAPVPASTSPSPSATAPTSSVISTPTPTPTSSPSAINKPKTQ